MNSPALACGMLWAVSTMCAAWCAALLVDTSSNPADDPGQSHFALVGLAAASVGIVLTSRGLSAVTAIERGAVLWQGIALVAGVAGLLPIAWRWGLGPFAAATMLPALGTVILLTTWQNPLTSMASVLGGGAR